MSFILSPNMNLPIPIVGNEPGPQYATDVNNSLTTVDGHNHTDGSGVQIPPAGLNINSDLTIQGNSLIAVGAITFQVLSSDAINLSMYMKGVDFYLRDGNGNVIRLTQGGSVSGASGTITGLPSGTASASYAAGVFTFQSATNTAANIDAGSYVFRNNTVGSNGITLQPPNALGSNYSLTLPALPPAQQIMTLDASGNMAAPYTVDNSTIIINSNIIQLNSKTVSLSASSGGSFGPLDTGGVFVDVVSLTFGVTTLSRAIKLEIISDGGGNTSYFASFSNDTTVFRIVDTLGGEYGRIQLQGQSGIPFIVPPSFSVFDNSPSSSKTYKLQMYSTGGDVKYCVLAAYQL